MPSNTYLECEDLTGLSLIRLKSGDGTNRLHLDFVLAMRKTIAQISFAPRPLIITGNDNYFSVGADLFEISSLTGTSAYDFARTGQGLMNALQSYPAPVYAAISGYCMGGGLDLALACHYRVASRTALFGHRGAALGLITGWGGTQRLPRLIGKGRALQMFSAAEKVSAKDAFEIGLVDAVADDPLAEALGRIRTRATRA
ncbi:MAG: enoyl-CoA hydratase/isomerase family protein [Acidobacteriota bacterium]|nr:enoyl-CoA hydratase/isomerase family protein [Acidobacteriota bacterium]